MYLLGPSCFVAVQKKIYISGAGPWSNIRNILNLHRGVGCGKGPPPAISSLEVPSPAVSVVLAVLTGSGHLD